MFRGGETVVIVRPDGERHRGEVAWVAGEKAGVQFDFVLPRLALKRLLSASEKGDRPAKDVEPLVDRFGRKLAPLERLVRHRQHSHVKADSDASSGTIQEDIDK
jgi:hypothetical protein